MGGARPRGPRRGHASRGGTRTGTASGVHAAEGRGCAPGPGQPRAGGRDGRVGGGGGAAPRGTSCRGGEGAAREGPGAAHEGARGRAQGREGKGRKRKREREEKGGELTSGIQIPAITVSKT
jgi:hypothetical protein